MHPLEKSVRTLCRQRGIIMPGDRLVVGVSGGPDSMALLHLLARLAPDMGLALIVAHVDHGLRPEAAEYEEALVRAAAADSNLDCRVGHVPVSAHARSRGLSVEEAGRDLRYNFFDSVASDFRANKIAVAHTADDQAEEVLLRLLRGAGKRGLSGMDLLRDGRIVRPLLDTDKERILAYLADRRIPFAHDASNTDRRYLRNTIRLDVLPSLARINPGIKETLRRTAAILREEDDFLEALAQADYTRLISEGRSADLPTATVACPELNQLHVAIRRRLLEKVLIHLQAKPGYRQIDDLIALAAGPGRHQLHLTNGLRATKVGAIIHLAYPQGFGAGRGNLATGAPPFA